MELILCFELRPPTNLCRQLYDFIGSSISIYRPKAYQMRIANDLKIAATGN
jgi:hypothetical protein